MQGRILVIGCGFIGSNIVEELVADGRPPAVLTRSKPAAEVAARIPAADLIVGDATDRRRSSGRWTASATSSSAPAACCRRPPRRTPRATRELTLGPVRAVLEAAARAPRGRPHLPLLRRHGLRRAAADSGARGRPDRGLRRLRPPPPRSARRSAGGEPRARPAGADPALLDGLRRAPAPRPRSGRGRHLPAPDRARRADRPLRRRRDDPRLHLRRRRGPGDDRPDRGEAARRWSTSAAASGPRCSRCCGGGAAGRPPGRDRQPPERGFEVGQIVLDTRLLQQTVELEITAARRGGHRPHPPLARRGAPEPV